MKRIDRYVLGVFCASWTVAVVFFMGMYVLIHFFSRLGKLGRAAQAFEEVGSSSWEGFASYYAVNFPFVMVEVLPFTLLMGGMWALQHMARRNELIPLVTSGVSFKRLCLPVVLLGFVISLVFSAAKEEVLPELALARQRMERAIKGEEEKRLENLNLLADGRGNLFLIDEYDVDDMTAYRVDILDAGDPGRHVGRIEGMRYVVGGDGPPGWYALDGAAVAPDLSFPLPTDLSPKDIEVESADMRYLSVPELRRLIARNPENLDLRVLAHEHFTYPLSSVILLLMGLPLVLRGERRSPYVAAGMSLLLSVAYYSFQSLTQWLGADGEILDPLLGAWLPVAVFGCVGLVLFEAIRT